MGIDVDYTRPITKQQAADILLRVHQQVRETDGPDSDACWTLAQLIGRLDWEYLLETHLKSIDILL